MRNRTIHISMPTSPIRALRCISRISLFFFAELGIEESKECIRPPELLITRTGIKKKRQIKRLTKMDTPYGHILPPMPVDIDKGKRKGLPKSAIPIAMLLCNQISSFKRLLFESMTTAFHLPNEASRIWLVNCLKVILLPPIWITHRADIEERQPTSW